jgi:hypothetical protein
MITFAAVLITLFAILALAIFGTLKRQARVLHAEALQSCARWLPALALCIFVVLLLANLFKPTMANLGLSSIGVDLKPAEAGVLLLTSMVFATRYINLGALATTLLYLIFSWNTAVGLGKATDVIFLLSQLILLFMGDKASWQQSSANGFGLAARRIGIIGVSIGAIIGVTFALFYVEDVKHLIASKLQMRISKSLIALILTAVILGWFGVGIRSLRPFLMPLLALPTVVAIQAICPLGPTMGVLLFALILSISWATSERRLRPSLRIDGHFSRKISYK